MDEVAASTDSSSEALSILTTSWVEVLSVTPHPLFLLDTAEVRDFGGDAPRPRRVTSVSVVWRPAIRPLVRG
jgi:hypothetical protein